MRFYKQQHKFYCGIDMHARKMCVCIIDLINRSKRQGRYNHQEVSDRFEDPAVKASVDADLAMIEAFNALIKKLEWQIEKSAWILESKPTLFDSARLREPI